ncbi:60S ribosomal protein L23a [Tupaia chinensis]|uniref:60S ribosomal protein L23a n=1 Tax=Tupaia chinensis TaxID=246437 RepID=L8Y7W8_TUPCH|nr:60S ribosomal protein L23a [Tupaia chinensis]
MAPKPKKEVPVPLKTEAKAKALQAKKAALKGAHGHKKKITHLPEIQYSAATQTVQISWKSAPRRNTLDHYAIIKFPLTTEAATKKIEDDNTLVLIVDVRANKHLVRQAVKKPCDVSVAKVSTLIRPDREKSTWATGS